MRQGRPHIHRGRLNSSVMPRAEGDREIMPTPPTATQKVMHVSKAEVPHLPTRHASDLLEAQESFLLIPSRT